MFERVKGIKIISSALNLLNTCRERRLQSKISELLYFLEIDKNEYKEMTEYGPCNEKWEDELDKQSKKVERFQNKREEILKNIA